MNNYFKKIIPQSLKIRYNHFLNQRKFDVKFGNNSLAINCIFEGRNLVNDNSIISDSYIGLGTYLSGNCKLAKAKIGKFCSIGQNVRNSFGIHPTNWVSTHPSFYSVKEQAGFSFVSSQKFVEHKFIDEANKYLIQIGNDVWIGSDVKIMDGVTIGDGAIIAFGTIVTKDVEPYSIIGGIPAKHIRYRFDEKEREFLKETKWWDKDLNWIKANAYNFDDLNKFIKIMINQEYPNNVK